MRRVRKTRLEAHYLRKIVLKFYVCAFTALPTFLRNSKKPADNLPSVLFCAFKAAFYAAAGINGSAASHSLGFLFEPRGLIGKAQRFEHFVHIAVKKIFQRIQRNLLAGDL